jgi:hypothetical protein
LAKKRKEIRVREKEELERELGDGGVVGTARDSSPCTWVWVSS